MPTSRSRRSPTNRLEPRSAEYLSGHAEDGDLDRISTFAITSAAHRIEAWRQAE
jgi:hypothetical protein